MKKYRSSMFSRDEVDRAEDSVLSSFGEYEPEVRASMLRRLAEALIQNAREIEHTEADRIQKDREGSE